MAALHPSARAWLDRVEDLANDLDPIARSELLADLDDHLRQALPVGADDTRAREVLARLGDPTIVVTEALHVARPTPRDPGGRPSRTVGR